MSKMKLPKSIAGVKIPKPWRRAAEAALAVLAAPAGRELFATALIAAAAALTREEASDAGEPPRPQSDRPRPAVDLGALIGLAATTAIGRLRAANERGDEGPATPPR